jgi:hypothetical protein
VGALHERVPGAGTYDRALGVVDDDTLRHPGEPLESAAVTTQPGHHRLIEGDLQVLMTRETAEIEQLADRGFPKFPSQAQWLKLSYPYFELPKIAEPFVST